ncbi:MAG TPA: TetR/AcrR family transcriptional regulator [Friedmanniella sp.]
MSSAARPTRREERRAQTVREIKDLAMDQISQGGPDAVSLSGIVREMSMSPAAVYRYFVNRDALLADLVVDAYDELADHLVALERAPGSAEDRLDAVLRGIRVWATEHPNAYRLIFQTSVGSGQDFAVDRTVPASSRSMSVVVHTLAAVASSDDLDRAAGPAEVDGGLGEAVAGWAYRAQLTELPTAVLRLALLTWTRLHGIISLELGGHLAATGIGADVLFDAEVRTIGSEAVRLPRAAPRI